MKYLKQFSLGYNTMKTDPDCVTISIVRGDEEFEVEVHPDNPSIGWNGLDQHKLTDKEEEQAEALLAARVSDEPEPEYFQGPPRWSPVY